MVEGGGGGGSQPAAALIEFDHEGNGQLGLLFARGERQLES